MYLYVVNVWIRRGLEGIRTKTENESVSECWKCDAMQCNAKKRRAVVCVCGGEDPSTKQSSIENNTYRYERPKKGFMHTPQLGPSVVTVPVVVVAATEHRSVCTQRYVEFFNYAQTTRTTLARQERENFLWTELMGKRKSRNRNDVSKQVIRRLSFELDEKINPTQMHPIEHNNAERKG